MIVFRLSTEGGFSDPPFEIKRRVGKTRTPLKKEPSWGSAFPGEALKKRAGRLPAIQQCGAGVSPVINFRLSTEGGFSDPPFEIKRRVGKPALR